VLALHRLVVKQVFDRHLAVVLSDRGLYDCVAPTFLQEVRIARVLELDKRLFKVTLKHCQTLVNCSLDVSYGSGVHRILFFKLYVQRHVSLIGLKNRPPEMASVLIHQFF
jgi:hypothetical protein